MKIAVVAFNDCMTSAVFGLLDAFAIATQRASLSNTSTWGTNEICLVTAGGAAILGGGGFRIEPQGSLDDARDADVVLVPPIMAGIEAVLARERPLIDWLATFRPNPTLLASTCTGAFLLAEAGVLDGRRITTNPLFRELFEQRYPRVSLDLDQRIVEDRMVLCAGSTTAYLDLALHIVDRFGGHDLAVATAKVLSMDKNPGSQRPYLMFVAPRGHGDGRVLQLQDWIETHHREPIGVEDMARAGGMSLRNLSRRFRLATGLSPVQYLRMVRVETAKRLLEIEDASTDRIAEQVGYGDPRAFIRAFGALAGLSPGQYRRRFRSL